MRREITLAMVLVAALLACKGGSGSSGSSKAAEVSVPVQQLLLEYKANEVAADQKYKGKRVRTTGIVDEIKKDFLDSIYVTIGTGAEFEIPSVQCYFDKSLANKAAALTKGQTISVDCDCDGLMLNVQMKNCAFVTQ